MNIQGIAEKMNRMKCKVSGVKKYKKRKWGRTWDATTVEYSIIEVLIFLLFVIIVVYLLVNLAKFPENEAATENRAAAKNEMTLFSLCVTIGSFVIAVFIFCAQTSFTLKYRIIDNHPKLRYILKIRLNTDVERSLSDDINLLTYKCYTEYGIIVHNIAFHEMRHGSDPNIEADHLIIITFS